MNEKLSDYISIFIKFILILSIINAVHNQYWHIASTNIFLLFLLFTPQILKKSVKINFPKEFEFALFIFVILTLMLKNLQGIVTPILFGVGTGMIGLIIVFILYMTKQIKKNYPLVMFFTLSFSLTFAVFLELLKYYLKKLLNQELNTGIYTYTMNNFTYVLIGAALASIIALIYMKTRFKLFRVIIEKLKNENQEFFKKNNSSTEILEEIKKGESSKQEFKSTLRINLHTNEIDKKIEHATLKTLVAFFNTEGGILYIGVNDKKEIIGIEKDKFENNDKFLLHFSNLFKQKIGKKHIKLIDYEIFEVDNKNILRIECSPSKKPIFLKEGKEENFFIRVGPETSELKASELIDYVKKRFDKKNK